MASASTDWRIAGYIADSVRDPRNFVQLAIGNEAEPKVDLARLSLVLGPVLADGSNGLAVRNPS